MKLEFSRQVLEKKAQISNLIGIHTEGTELLRADGQTERHDEAESRISQFANEPKNCTGLALQ